MEIREFLERLAVPSPTPGGGSASALAGALSASLVAMVAGLSIKRGEIGGPRARKIQKRALLTQKRLLQTVEEDARSYEAVVAALRLPKDTERQKEKRLKKVEVALKKATKPPEAVCKACIELLQHCGVLLSRGNPNAWSDVAVGALLADAALQGALFNIEINLESIKDRAFLRRMKRQIGLLKKRAEKFRRLKPPSGG